MVPIIFAKSNDWWYTIIVASIGHNELIRCSQLINNWVELQLIGWQFKWIQTDWVINVNKCRTPIISSLILKEISISTWPLELCIVNIQCKWDIVTTKVYIKCNTCKMLCRRCHVNSNKVKWDHQTILFMQKFTDKLGFIRDDNYFSQVDKVMTFMFIIDTSQNKIFVFVGNIMSCYHW